MKGRGHLTVGVGVGTAHHFPLVLKHLHPLVCLPQFCDLIGPFVNHSAYLSQFHEGQGQVRARMKTHHTTVKKGGEGEGGNIAVTSLTVDKGR